MTKRSRKERRKKAQDENTGDNEDPKGKKKKAQDEIMGDNEEPKGRRKKKVQDEKMDDEEEPAKHMQKKPAIRLYKAKDHEDYEHEEQDEQEGEGIVCEGHVKSHACLASCPQNNNYCLSGVCRRG